MVPLNYEIVGEGGYLVYTGSLFWDRRVKRILCGREKNSKRGISGSCEVNENHKMKRHLTLSTDKNNPLREIMLDYTEIRGHS